MPKALSIFITALILLSACQPASPPPPAGETNTPFFPDLSAEETPSPTPTPAAESYWINPLLPQSLQAAPPIPADWKETPDADAASYRIDLASDAQADAYWHYALVAPFSTILDGISVSELQALWTAAEPDQFLFLTREIRDLFAKLWGPPSSAAVKILPADEILATAWQRQPALALIPFEALEPRWKVLTVDGQAPIHKEFDPAGYPLAIPIQLSDDFDWPPISNRDPERLTTVVVTGVTALVRATAYEMNRSGVLYPAEDIGPLLASADITHISNEVPFWEDCPPPDPVQRNLIFCSDPSYYALLEEVGTDIVELTGDHFNDYGQQAMLYTLDIYDENDLPYYGGGRDIEDGLAAWTTEHNGNRIAFIGCNGKGGGYATADEDSPGAVDCDYPYLAEEIARLEAEGYLVITTFQHNEVYTFIPQPGLIRDFGIVAEAGSAIVSGSQAHQTHGMEFTDADTLIMYGLGNLFFDQRGVVNYGDQALIARHVFYDGRYLSTELFTIIFVDFAKPRFMTAEERAEFLATVFEASRFEALLEGS